MLPLLRVEPRLLVSPGPARADDHGGRAAVSARPRVATLSFLAYPHVEAIYFVFLMIILSILMVSPFKLKKV